jgi:hypothetical protein
MCSGVFSLLLLRAFFFAFVFPYLSDAPFLLNCCAPFLGGGVVRFSCSTLCSFYELLSCAVSVTSIDMQLLWVLDVLFV